MPLSDDIIVYPAHGAGSACGKKMSQETTDSLGNQKKTNYALRPDMTKEEFIGEVLSGLAPPPGYFPQNVMLNIKGYESLDTIMERGTKALKPREFEMLATETEAVLLDTRDPELFVKGFVPNSTNIGLDGNFASWVGTLVPDVNQAILFIADKGKEEEVITRLARVGYDNTIGYLEGGFESWKDSGMEVDQIDSIAIDSLIKKKGAAHMLDVRRASEFNSEHIVGALNAPLDYINETMSTIHKDKSYYVYCRTGYRSVVFISILKARGFENLINVEGGLEEAKETGAFQLTEFVEPTTML